MIVPLVDLLEIGIGVGAVAVPMAIDMYEKKDILKDALEKHKQVQEQMKKEKEKK